MQMLLQQSPFTLSEDLPPDFYMAPQLHLRSIEEAIWCAIAAIMELDEAVLDEREAQFRAMRHTPEGTSDWHDRVPSRSNPRGKYSRHYELSAQDLSADQIDQIAFWLWERDHGRGLLPTEETEADYIDGMVVLQWLLRGWMAQEAELEYTAPEV